MFARPLPTPAIRATAESAPLAGVVLPSTLVSQAPLAATRSVGAAAVRCRGLTKDFGTGEARVQALRGVDLELPSGELALLVGESGCGKTTLISLIAGLLEPTAGEVAVFGQPLQRFSGKQLADFRARHIGFVFQQYNLLPALSACENVAVPLLILGQPRREALARAASLLAAVGLGHKQEALPTQLSGGQQQRVAIARALVHEPRLLVCDEPTAALDARSGHTIMELLRSVAVHPERAVIVVTHDSRVFSFGDRLVHMEDGRVERLEILPAREPARAPSGAAS
ncbi:MAG: ABC transporter ATP-binding protein [Pirellulales bacterium]